MKGKRLKDVLDEELTDLDFWNKMFRKMNNLLILMEEIKGDYVIDDPEIRWVSDRIEYFNAEERILTKKEMQIANVYWDKYNGSINII